jgi:hypothetical protein
VPETAAFRVDLQPSRHARRLRVLAQVLCAVATLVCATALVVEPAAARTVAALLAAVALLMTLRPRARLDLLQLGVGADGRVYVGAAAAGTPAAAAMCYVGEGCVCLQTAGGPAVDLAGPDACRGVAPAAGGGPVAGGGGRRGIGARR